MRCYLRELNKILLRDDFKGDYDKNLELLGHVAAGSRHKSNMTNLLRHLARSDESKELLTAYLEQLIRDQRWEDVLTFHCNVWPIDLEEVFDTREKVEIIFQYLTAAKELNPKLFSYVVTYNNGEFSESFAAALQK